MRTSFVLVAALAACGSDIPETVYVPAANYRQSLSVALVLADDTTIRPGVHYKLSVMREMGPWRAAPRDSVNLETCWRGSPPAELEREVAANVRFHVEPFDSVTFNIPMPPDSTRTVRFGKPGTYRLWAESHGCPYSLFSDTLILPVK